MSKQFKEKKYKKRDNSYLICSLKQKSIKYDKMSN